MFCTSAPNLVILSWTGDELWCGQAQNVVILEIYISILTKVFLHHWYKFGDPGLEGLMGCGADKLRVKTHAHTRAEAQTNRWPSGSTQQMCAGMWGRYTNLCFVYNINECCIILIVWYVYEVWSNLYQWSATVDQSIMCEWSCHWKSKVSVMGVVKVLSHTLGKNILSIHILLCQSALLFLW